MLNFAVNLNMCPSNFTSLKFISNKILDREGDFKLKASFRFYGFYILCFLLVCIDSANVELPASVLQNFGFVVFEAPEPVQDILKQRVCIELNLRFSCISLHLPIRKNEQIKDFN